MCICVDHFGFLNLYLGGWGVQIRDQRFRTEFHRNQMTFPAWQSVLPQGPFLLYLPLLYIEYI